MNTEEIDIEKYIKINELNIEYDLSMCSAYYFTIASMEVEAEDLYEQATLILETYEVELFSRVKKQLDLPKITQTEITRQFRGDPKWQELKKEQLKLQRNFRLLHKGAAALEMKSRMLMSLNRRDIFAQDKLGKKYQNSGE